MKFLFDHTAFGFCWWDLVALLILIGVILVMIFKVRKQKKELDKLQKVLSEVAEEEAQRQKAAEGLKTTETKI